MYTTPLELRVSQEGSYSQPEPQQKRRVSFIPFEGNDYKPTIHHGERICEIRQMDRGIHELLRRLKAIGAEVPAETEIYKRRTKDPKLFPYKVRMQDIEEEIHRGYGQDNGTNHLDEYLHLIGKMHAAGIMVSRYETRKAATEGKASVAATKIPAIWQGKLILYDWTKLTVADTLEVKPPFEKHSGEWNSRMHFDLADPHGFGAVIGAFENTEEARGRAEVYLAGFKSVDPKGCDKHREHLYHTLFPAFWKEGKPFNYFGVSQKN